MLSTPMKRFIRNPDIPLNVKWMFLAHCHAKTEISETLSPTEPYKFFICNEAEVLREIHPAPPSDHL